MVQTIEETVKALTEFEAELDRVKAEAVDSRKRLLKNSGEWAESAKVRAISMAQQIAEGRIAAAKAEAEKEAESVTAAGQESRKVFEGSLSQRKDAATQLVTKRLLGVKS